MYKYVLTFLMMVSLAHPITYSEIVERGKLLAEKANVYEQCAGNTFAHTDGTDIYICEEKVLEWMNNNGVTEQVDIDAAMRIVLTHELGHILYQHVQARLTLAHARVDTGFSSSINISFEKEADELAFTVNAKKGTLKACSLFGNDMSESSTHPSDFSRTEACRQLFIRINPTGKI